MLLAALAACTAHGAVIYKWTDADGVVHYSDQPSPGAEKIITSGISTYSGATPARGAQNPAPTAKKLGTAAAPPAIVSPTPEQSFFGDEPINVMASPALQPNQTIVWRLNGAPLSDQGPTTTQFTLQSLARGTYSLDAVVNDGETGETQALSSVTFYVRQPSELSPMHRNR